MIKKSLVPKIRSCERYNSSYERCEGFPMTWEKPGEVLKAVEMRKTSTVLGK
jgi:hypothetical protein